MVSSCNKCGKKVNYGVTCGQCLLGASISDKLFYSKDKNKKDNQSNTQGNYSRFKNFKITTQEEKKNALLKYMMDPKGYESTITQNSAPKYNSTTTNGKTSNYFMLVNDLVSKVRQTYGLSDKKYDSNVTAGSDYIIVISKDSKTTYFVPIRESLKSSSNPAYLKSGSYMKDSKGNYGIASGKYVGKYAADSKGSSSDAKGSSVSSKGSSASK